MFINVEQKGDNEGPEGAASKSQIQASQVRTQYSVAVLLGSFVPP